MKVKDTNLNSFLSTDSVEFIIPTYQRNYAWQREQCQQLLDDLRRIAQNDKEHFLGTITYITHQGEGGVREFVVIDGQQQLTSVMLLLKALQQNASKSRTDLHQRLNRFLFNFEDEGRLRLKPIKKDREAFELVMKGQSASVDGESRVADNYKFFRSETKALENEQIAAILNAFSRLQLAEVVLDQKAGDDPQMVFERINATGLHLTGLDLIRNFLMMELAPSEQERIFNEFWRRLEDLFIDDKDSEKAIGGEFLPAYLRVYYHAKAKDDDKAVYNLFKQLRKERFEDASEWILRDMLKFARIYKVLKDRYFAWEFELAASQKAALRDKLDNFNEIKFGVALPLLMRLTDDLQNGKLDALEFDKILNLLLSYFVRRSVCGMNTSGMTSAIYPLYSRLGDEVSAQGVAKYLGTRSSAEGFPDDAVVQRDFLQKPFLKIAPFVLRQIERQSGTELGALSGRKLDYFYPKVAGNLWREGRGESEIQEIEWRYVETIGNLSLLEEGLNSTKANKSFKEKVAVYDERAEFWTNRFFTQCDKWGVKEIRRRASELFERFKEVEIFRDLDAEFRQRRAALTLNECWTFVKPAFVRMPDGEQRRASSHTEVVKEIFKWLMQNYPREFKRALNSGFGFIYFDKVEPKGGSVIIEFDEFVFQYTKSAEGLRSCLKRFVEKCELSAEDFEITHY